MSYSITDLRDWAVMLRRLGEHWPESARGDELEQLCGKAGLYLSDAWGKGFFNRAAWVELRDWLYEPNRVTAFDFYCRSVEFLWWGWDQGRWTKGVEWPDAPEDRPAKADMPRLANSREGRVTLKSGDGQVVMDSGAPPQQGPPASARVLRYGCIVWATILEREGTAEHEQSTSRSAGPDQYAGAGRTIEKQNAKATLPANPASAHPSPQPPDEHVAVLRETLRLMRAIQQEARLGSQTPTLPTLELAQPGRDVWLNAWNGLMLLKDRHRHILPGIEGDWWKPFGKTGGGGSCSVDGGPYHISPPRFVGTPADMEVVCMNVGKALAAAEAERDVAAQRRSRNTANQQDDENEPYMPADWFDHQFGIPEPRLRSARRNGRIASIDVGDKRPSYRYSVPGAIRLWPGDNIFIPDVGG